jgi:hypothetical protein
MYQAIPKVYKKTKASLFLFVAAKLCLARIYIMRRHRLYGVCIIARDRYGNFRASLVTPNKSDKPKQVS